MKGLFRGLSGNERLPAALPPRCRWERAPLERGRAEWAIVCPPEGDLSHSHPGSLLPSPAGREKERETDQSPSSLRAERSNLSSAQGLLRRSAPRNDRGDNPRWPVLYLLHGSGHDPLSYFTLLPMDSLLPLMAGVCLVFAEGQKGWYLDSPMVKDSQRERAFLRTLEWVESRYPVGGAREKRGIFGFSMGGFGAMHLASRHPDLFASASSLIGPLDIEALWPDHEALRRLLGPNIETWRAHNPAETLRPSQGDGLGIAVLVTTAQGAWDRRLNQSFLEACRARGIAVTYREHPGEHGTEFVAAHLQEHLEFHLSALTASPWQRTIRAVRLEDAGALARNCFSQMTPEEVLRHVAWSLEESARGRRVHLVADTGEAVGNGELSVTGDTAEIANLVVTQSRQGQGLGTALMEELTRLAAARGVRALEIGVRSADPQTRALYERLGFAPFREAVMPIGGESVAVTYLRKQLTGE